MSSRRMSFLVPSQSTWIHTLRRDQNDGVPICAVPKLAPNIDDDVARKMGAKWNTHNGFGVRNMLSTISSQLMPSS